MRLFAFRLWGLAAALFGALALTTVAAQAQQTEPEVRETHGDWQILCVTDDQCFMSQVKTDSEGRRIMVFNLRVLPEPASEDGETFIAIIQVITPLNIHLPYGLRTQIDEGEVGRIPFERCAREGCLAVTLINDEFVGQMKAGGVIKLAVLPVPGQPTEIIEMSLIGFTAAYDSL